LGFTAGGITRRLDAMVREGLVERLPDPEDGRALLVRLTPAGVDLAKFLLKDADHRSHALEQTFTLEEWKMLSDLLRRFEKAIE
jgi:DNA-binding MarR family transcriptional regulator